MMTVKRLCWLHLFVVLAMIVIALMPYWYTGDLSPWMLNFGLAVSLCLFFLSPMIAMLVAISVGQLFGDD